LSLPRRRAHRRFCNIEKAKVPLEQVLRRGPTRGAERSKPATFDENVALIAEDDQRERATLERMQRALDERREAKWKKKR
jgi:hypothetical protein